MQVQGSPTYWSYGSADSNGAPEIGPDVELVKIPAENAVLTPLNTWNEITIIQEDVSRARQDLLVERSKTRSAGEAVRLQRMATGDVEGQLLNALRDYYNSTTGSFPPSITEAYERVIHERDRLGAIEDSYFEAERTLGGSEWKFMQKEEVLYQYHLPDLLARQDLPLPELDVDSRPPPPPDPILLGNDTVLVHDAPPPPPPPQTTQLTSRGPLSVTESLLKTQSTLSPELQTEDQYRVAVAELDSLRKEFDSLRPEQCELLEQEWKRKPYVEASEYRVRSQVLFERYSTLLDRLSEKEVEVQLLHQTRLRAPDMSDEWMLNYAKTSPMERHRYMNVLEQTGVISTTHDDSLDEWSELYWFSQALKSSLDDGQDAVKAVGNRPYRTSSTSRDISDSAKNNATPESHIQGPAQPSPQSLPLLVLDEDISQSQDNQRCSRSFTHDHLDSAKPYISKRASESWNPLHWRPFLHRRSKSVSAMFEQRDAADSGGGFRAFYPPEIEC
jgi:hypothetical protein